jgi:hypothetical protein
MSKTASPHPITSGTTLCRTNALCSLGIAAALMVALAIAGCGGSTKAKSASIPTITKSEFVAKANAICASADPTLSAENAKLLSHPSTAAVREAVKNVYVPSIEGQIARIHALGTPVGEDATVKHLLVLVQADLNKIKRNPLLIVTPNAFSDFAKVAHPYGMTACAPLS